MAIAVVLLAACSSHSAANASLANLTFGEYLRIYGKQYDDPREYTQREAAFIKAMATIAQHNAEFNTSWKMGVSEHTDLLSHEFKAMSSGRHAALAATLAAARPTHDAPQFAPRDLPTQVDWRDKKVLTRVKNQGSCGSCWAFSTVESIESAVALASGTLLQLSPQQLVDCVVNSKHCGGTGGCEGATQSLGFEYVATHGLAGIDAYPYGGRDGHCHYDNRSMHAVGITGWVQLPTNNYTSLLHAVATVGPISVSVDASSWQHYAQGVFDVGGSDINHAVLLVGYGSDDESGDDYWLVRNSWGSDWGEDGYIRLKRHGEGREPCAQDRHPGDGYACAPLPKEIQVCGLDGILSDSSYPTGAHVGPK